MKNPYAIGLVTGIIMLVATFLLSMILGIVFPSVSAEYVNPAFRPWSDPVMMLFYVYPIMLGFLASWVWMKTRKSWKNGLDFGLTMALFSAIPTFLVNYSSFTFSLPMILSWTIMGFVNMVIAGLALGKLSE